MLEGVGIRAIFQNIGGDTDEKVLENAEIGGVVDGIMKDLVA